MSKLTLAALVSGLALSLASPVFAAPADADQPAPGPNSKKGITPKADTRSEKAKAAGAVAKTGAEPAAAPAPKKERVAKPDTRSEAAKAAGAVPKGGAEPANAPEAKPKKK